MKREKKNAFDDYSYRDYMRARPFLAALNRAGWLLSGQEYRTLKGCALAGDTEGAEKGLEKILRRRELGG